jgi:hypothetical protein
MRQDKTFARILLIFSIANVILAAPALVQQRRLVTDRTDDELTSESEQDPAGPVHQEVVPASPPPSVGSPAGSEKSPTLSESWSDDPQFEYLSKSSDSDSDSAPNSQFGSHQDSVPVSGGLPLEHKPFPWWEHSDWRPPGKWEVGEPSYSGPSALEMLPPASVAQPLHYDTVGTTPWWHSLNSVTDMDQASTMSWASKVSGWSEAEAEAEAKVAEETRPHL